MVSIPDRLRQLPAALRTVLSAQRNGDAPAPPLGEAAPLSKDTQFICKLFGNTLSNPDPLMSQQRPTNSAAYLAGFGLYEEVLDNDPAIYGNVKQRQLEVLASARSLNPANDSPEAMTIHSFIAHWIDELLDDWEGALAELWMANWYGVTYLEAGYELQDVEFDDGGTPQRLADAAVIERFWSRRRGRFVFDTDYNLKLLTGSSLTTGEPVPDRKILHHAPRKRYENPYGEPLARTVYRWHYLKKHAAKWKAIDLERWGSPFAWLKHPPGATAEQLASYDALLRSIQTGTGIRTPDDVTLELLNVFHGSTSSSPHEAVIEMCDKQAALAILGQTLTSQQGSKSEGGTNALGQVHERVLDKIAQADADNLAAAFNTAIGWMVELNFGASALRLAPKLSIDASNRDALAYLKAVEQAQKVGLPVSRSQAYGETPFEEPDDDDVLEAPRAPSPFGALSLGDPPAPDDDGSGGRKPKDEKQSQRRPGRPRRRQAIRLNFADPFSGEATLPAGPIRSALPSGFKGAEIKRARVSAELADKLPPLSELRQLYEDGVTAQSGILNEIPELVGAWVREQYAARGLGPDALIGHETPGSDPVTLPWQDLELPGRIKQAFVDRLNDDHTIAQLLSREAVLLAADALGIETPGTAAFRLRQRARLLEPMRRQAAGDDPLENPVAEALFGAERIIPRRVMSVHSRRVFQSVEFDTFYKLDSLARAQSFTAWDLLESDVRHIGGALQDAIQWGYTVQQFEDYLVDRLKPRYVQQGTEMHAWHTQVIYHTNLSVAANQAQADEAWDLQDAFPYVLFFNPDPQAPPCVERAGRVYRVDGGFLSGSTPPLHFGCQSSLELLTEEGAREEGFAVESEMPLTAPETYSGPRDPYTGEPVGEPHPFGAWAPVEERYQHLEEELARVGGTP